MPSNITKKPINPQTAYKYMWEDPETEAYKRLQADREAVSRMRRGDIGNSIWGDPSMRTVEHVDPRTTVGQMGESKYDTIMLNPDARDVTNNRAQTQSGFAKIAAGTLKGVATAGTTFLNNTVGLATGILQGIANMSDNDPKTGFWSGIWNNAFTEAMDTFQQYLEKELPNYKTEYEQEHPLALDNILSANFLADFVKNSGFTIGAMYSGGLASKALRFLGSGKAAGAVRAILSSGFSAIGEGSLEALNGANDWAKAEQQRLRNEVYDTTQEIDRLYRTGQISLEEATSRKKAAEEGYVAGMSAIEEDKNKMGNAVLAMNFPILTLSSLGVFGKAFATGFKTTRRISHIIDNNPELTLLQKAKQGIKNAFSVDKSKWRLVWDISKRGLSEGGEEISQNAAKEVAGLYFEDDVTNHYLAKADPDAEQKTLSAMRSLIQGVTNTLGSEQAWYEGLAGFLTGILGVPTFGKSFTSGTETWAGRGKSIGMTGGIGGAIREYNLQNKRDTELVNAMNQRIQDPKFLNYYQGVIAHNKEEDEKAKALNAGDIFSYYNHDHAQLVGDIAMFDNAGKLDQFSDMIKALTETNDDSVDTLISATLGTYDSTDQYQGRMRELEGRKKQYQDALNSTVASVNDETIDPEERERSERAMLFYNEKLEETEEQIKQLQEEGKTSISPFTDNEGNIIDREELKQHLEKKRTQILDAVKIYKEAKRDIDEDTDFQLNADQLGALSWIKSHTKNWHDRASQMSDEINETLGDFVSEILDKAEVKEKAALDELDKELKEIREKNNNKSTTTEEEEKTEEKAEEKKGKAEEPKKAEKEEKKKSSKKDKKEELTISREEIEKEVLKKFYTDKGVGVIRRKLSEAKTPLERARILQNTFLGEYLKNFLIDEADAIDSGTPDARKTSLDGKQVRELFRKVEDTIRCLNAADQYEANLSKYMMDKSALDKKFKEADKKKKKKLDKKTLEGFLKYIDDNTIKVISPKQLRKHIKAYIENELKLKENSAEYANAYNVILDGLESDDNLKNFAKRLKKLHSYVSLLDGVVEGINSEEVKFTKEDGSEVTQAEKSEIVAKVANEITSAFLEEGKLLEVLPIESPQAARETLATLQGSNRAPELRYSEVEIKIRDAMYQSLLESIKSESTKKEEEKKGEEGEEKEKPSGGKVDWEELNDMSPDELTEKIEEYLNNTKISELDKNALRKLLDSVQSAEHEGHLDNETDDDQLGNGSREIFKNRIKGRPLADTVAVDGITEYQIDGLKEGKAIPYNPEEDSNLSEDAKKQIKLIQGIKKELGIYNFVNSGNLAASKIINKKSGGLPIYYGVHKKDGKDFIVLYIKKEDAFSPTHLITINGEEYQAVGILTEPTERYVVDDEEKEKDNVEENKEWYENKRQEILAAQKAAGAEGQEHFVSESFTHISFMYSGRLLSTKKEAWSGDGKSNRPLSEVRGFEEDMGGSRIVVWASTVKGGSTSGGSAFYAGNTQWNPGTDVVPFNKDQPDGSLWLLTDGADGNTYAKALRVETYNPNRNPDSSIAKDIDECINILFDKSKLNYEKVRAKIKLQTELLYFGKDNNILINNAGNLSFTRKVYTGNNKTATTELKDAINSPEQLKKAIVDAGIRYQVKKAWLGSTETVYRKANGDGQSYSEALLEAGVITTDLVAVQNVDASFEIYKDPNSKSNSEGTKKVEPEPAPGPILGATPKLNEVGSVALNDSENTVFIKDKDGNFYKGPEGTPLDKMTQIDEDEYNLAKKIQKNGGIENGKLYYEDPDTGKTYYIFMDMGGSSDSLGPIIIAEKDKDSSNFTLSFHKGSDYKDNVIKRIVGALQNADERISKMGTMKRRGKEKIPNDKPKAERQAIFQALFTPDVSKEIKDCKTLADIAKNFEGLFESGTQKEAKRFIESIKTCGK